MKTVLWDVANGTGNAWAVVTLGTQPRELLPLKETRWKTSASMPNLPVHREILLTIRALTTHRGGGLKRQKNGTPHLRAFSNARKCLKRWLLRLDSNQQPSG